MKQLLNLLIPLLIISQLSVAQTLNGIITDKSGQPVQYATIYIREINQGTTSNTKGEYELRLGPGNYSLTCQSLGYEPVNLTVAISDRNVTRDIVLPDQIYEIPEVKVSHSSEDPAYAIIRKAIGLAPYYLNFVDSYKAEVYLKGNLLIKKIPRLFQKSMKMGRSQDNIYVSAGGKPEPEATVMKEGDSFFMESYNEIEFTAPDKYLQKVISFNSTFPEQGNEISPMSFIKSSFYQPVLADIAISPLSPQAFSHYRFRYAGATLQGNYTINKIEVIPKRKSQQLFEGTIYIIEDFWCLQSVDLTNDNLAGRIRIRQLYIPVKEETWMPVSLQLDMDLQFLGLKAAIGYAGSVKYMDVKPNDKLQKPSDIAAGFPERSLPDSAVTKETKDINNILRKENLSNRDMVKLARLLNKETATHKNDTAVKTREIKDNTTQIVEKDAGKKDSSYWAAIRPIPLTEIELKSLRISDSVKTVNSFRNEGITDTLKKAPVKTSSSFGRTVKNILLGHTWTDKKGFSFTNNGLIDLENISFNTVDGFVYGMNFGFYKRIDEKRNFSFYPEIRYAFSRKDLMLKANASYNLGGLNPKKIFLRSGIATRDFNTGTGINPFINSLSSLLFRNNYLKLYKSTYLNIGYNYEITNGLALEVSTGYEDRRTTGNNSDFSIFRRSKDYTENIPVNDYLTPGSILSNLPGVQKHFEISTVISFTPGQKFKIYDGNKSPQGSDWPVFRFSWKRSFNKIPEISNEIKTFDSFRFEVSGNHDTGPFSEFKWLVRAGGYVDNRNLTFFDFFHFNAQPVYVLINDYDDAFMIPQYYSLSTPEVFGEFHMRYTTPYLLLKLLPGLSNTLIRENIFVSYLGSRYRTNYTEIGYSLSEIFLIGQAGVFFGFDDFNYRNFGLRFSFRIN